MIDWTTFFQIIIAVTGTAGLIGWFIKSLFGLYLQKDMEKFKATLLEDRIRFSKLHEKRAEIIAELYSKIVEIEIYLEEYKSLPEKEIKKQNEELIKIIESLKKLYAFQLKNKIYFNKYQCSLLIKVIDHLHRLEKEHLLDYIDKNMPNIKESSKKEAKKIRELVKKGLDKIEKEIIDVQANLEKEFRNILGVK